MSAGRGIIHSEMPTQDSQGLHGFQLWFNLPAAEKMDAPRYRDLPLDALARVRGESFTLTAVSGAWSMNASEVTSGPLSELAAQAALADLNLDAAAVVSIATANSESVMVYVYNGQLEVDGTSRGSQQLLLFTPGERLRLCAGPEGAGLLVLRGQPIGEPVVHYGPFVMNSKAEIEQAIRDYQAGRFAA